MKTAIKGKWSNKPPTVAGWWFVSQLRRGKRHVQLCEVRARRETFGPRRYQRILWQWSFIDGLTWNNTTDYPKYQWPAGVKAQ
jgi:hypothetical protein